MKFRHLVPLFLLFFLSLAHVHAQSSTENTTSVSADTVVADTAEEKKVSLLAVPIIFYTPETRWAFGAAVFAAFRFKNEKPETKPSQIQLGAAYTLNKQVLSYLPYRLYWGQEKNLVYGELGYYIYNYYFYGIGNDTPEGYRELYDLRLPRVRINAMRLVAPNFYLGGRFLYDGMDITRVDSGGLLAQGNITGYNGGSVSGLGIASNYDTRDNILWPSSGIFAEALVFRSASAFASEFTYSRISVNASKYNSLKWGHIVAQNLYMDFMTGDPPFYQMAMLGGAKNLRGIYEGAYRDRNALAYQVEYRAPIWWRFGLVGFMAGGMVADKIENFSLSNMHLAGGAGIRFEVLEKEKLHIRLDYGLSKNNSGFYFTVGEAF